MSRNLFLTLFAMATVVIAVNFFLTVPQEWYQEEAVIRSTEEIHHEEDYIYELKTVNGKLAVFFYGEKQPRMVLDVYVQTLPKLDQQQLHVGIPVKNYEELLKRIEDYSS